MAKKRTQKIAKFHYLYQITNMEDGKVYVGVHSTDNLEDGYMGSGRYIKAAIKKHGKHAFRKDILQFFDNASDMYAREKQVVTESFLRNKRSTYNLCRGGDGGFGYINANTTLRIEKNQKAANTTNSRHSDKLAEWGRKGALRKLELYGPSVATKEFIEFGRWAFYGKHHTEDAKRRIGEANRIHQAGKKNSQYGKMWITNGLENKSIKKTDPIPEGFVKGRKLRL